MTERELPENARLIPENATKVFGGIIFDVYHWEQEQFDGSYRTFEMLKRPDTVVVIALDENNQVITLREEQPLAHVREMGLPGGRVDTEDQDTLMAAQREMHEETGITLKEWKLVEIVQPQSKIEYFIYAYIARGVVARDEPHEDPGERIEVGATSYEVLREHGHGIVEIELFENITTLEELEMLFDVPPVA